MVGKKKISPSRSPFSLLMPIGDHLDGFFYCRERGVFQVRLLAWLEAFAHMR